MATFQITHPLQRAYQRATLGLSLRQLEKETGIVGLKDAFYEALQKRKNIENLEDPIWLDDISAVIGSSSFENYGMSALFISAHSFEGNWASRPNYRISIRSQDLKDGEVVSALSSMDFSTNALGQFKLASTGVVGRQGGPEFIGCRARSPQIDAFEAYLKKRRGLN